MKHRLALLFSLAAACGSSGHSGPTTITDVTPADGATKVSAYTTVTIQLSGGDPDASSVNATTVRLYYGTSKLAVPSAVAYDADAQTITLTPMLPLAGVSFRLDVNGVTAGGVALPEKTATFSSFVDPLKSLLGKDPTGADNLLDHWDHDASGNVTKLISYAAGPDGMLGTADDVIKHYFVYVPPANGHRQSFEYDDPGPDGLWQTADDPIAAWTDDAFGAAGDTLDVTYGDPGPDGQWQTADDVPAYYTALTYDSQDRMIKFVSAGVGSDNKVGTDDDEDSVYQDLVYDDIHTAPSQTISHFDPGPDGVWGTADDQLSALITSFDDHGGITGTQDVGAGPDGKFGTADDVVSDISVMTLDAHHALVQRNDIFDAGPDGKFGTADDVVGEYEKYTIDASGVLTEDDLYSNGTDNTAFTADDFIQVALSYDDSL